MKLLISLLAVAGLSGCVAYGGAPYGSASVYYSNQPTYGSYGYYGNSAYSPSWRDRDGDGVPNRYDAYPDNPRRR